VATKCLRTPTSSKTYTETHQRYIHMCSSSIYTHNSKHQVETRSHERSITNMRRVFK
jgi:hypothetical protein